MHETSIDRQTERLSIRRPMLALSALRTVLEEMTQRIDPAERELCERALLRLTTLSVEIDALAGRALPTSSEPVLACTLGEVCRAARHSLPRALRDRLLASAEQSAQPILIDDARLIAGLRDLAQSMFSRGANAVLLNANLEGTDAVFALIDDRQGPAPTCAETTALALPDFASMHGTVSPIGSAHNPQGVIVRIPVALAPEAYLPPINTGGEAR
ncbi:MAG: hypothetical protein ACI8QZ_000028 [Chlamydiales bacterium]|jgi:hypothetical protein